MKKKFHVFDAYGTLLDVHSATAKILDFSREDVQEFSHIWRAKQLEYTWVYSMMGVYKNFWILTKEALEFALKAVPSIDLSQQAELAKAYMILSAYEDVKPYLTELRCKGFTTGILSNGCPTMLSAATEHAELAPLLDQRISVDQARLYKTNPVIYKMILDIFDCKKAEVCFYSSNRWDIAGASEFGLQTIWVNRTGQPDEYVEQPFFKEVPSLADISV